MEILATIAYFFLVRLVFFEYQWLRFTLVWKFVVFGLYIAAGLTEVILLGQYTPYSKQAFLERPVIQMAPEFGGLVKAVHVAPNVPVKKGDLLFEMDPTPWQTKVDELTPQVDIARRHYEDSKALVEAKAQREELLQQRRDALAAVEAELEKAQYNLDNAKILAPADGYVVNLQLRPGNFIRLKQPVVTFVSSEEAWLVALIRQRGAEHVRAGDKAQVAFEMYPGRIFEAEVESVVYALGDAQLTASGLIPMASRIHSSDLLPVKLRITAQDPDHPLRFAASGLVAIFTEPSPEFCVALRKIEIQSESFLFYVYNPF
jgi:multidrug resistance efflux pump